MQQETLFKQKYGDSRSYGAPMKGSLAKSLHSHGSVASPTSAAIAGKRQLKKGQPKKLSKDELIAESLKEIFDFYARQHIQNNQGFEEMQEGLKKIDLGEFNGFLRDFKLNLPRQKTNELFLKAGDNLKEIGRDHFKKAIILVGTEYAHAKLREHKERLKEWNKLIEDLKIPESYTNTAGTEEARE